MNQLAHVCLTYVILSFFIVDAHKYLLPIAVFAIVLDIDHLPGYVRMLSLSRKEKSRLRIVDYVNIFRTAVQEPVGILVIEIVILSLYLFGVSSIYLLIAGLAIFLHWFIDFLTVHTRPFDPIDKRIVCLFFKTKKQRLISEGVITAVSVVLFAVVWFS